MGESAAPQLTATAWTALGFIALTPRSGYDIKQAAEQHAEAFWGISYAQLYPQLKNLHALGLIEPAADGGPRGQTVWRATSDGCAALHDWLRRPPATPQLRDEALLKLVFVDALAPADALVLIDHKRRELLGWVEHFETGPGADARPLLRAYGLGQARAGLEWCDAATRELTDRAAEPAEPHTT